MEYWPPNAKLGKIAICVKKNSERDGPEISPNTPHGSRATVVFQIKEIESSDMSNVSKKIEFVHRATASF